MEDLAGQQDIAFDTEADSFFSYREKVCLVQVTVEDRERIGERVQRRYRDDRRLLSFWQFMDLFEAGLYGYTYFED